MQVDDAWYLMTWYKPDHGLRTAISLYGPYTSKGLAAVDGQRWQQAHQNNPCWQCVKGYPTIHVCGTMSK